MKPKTMIEIKHRHDGKVLFSGDFESVLKCAEAAVKSGADLGGADLRGADLRGAGLRGAYLRPIRSDFLAEVLRLPDELEFLRDALIAGKVSGTTYNDGECGCLAGTLAIAKGIEGYSGTNITNGLTFHADSSSPREVFFTMIRKGDTPETNPASAIALEWTNEAIAIRDNIRAAAAPAKAS